MRDVGGEGVYIGLSQEFTRWAKIQNPKKVWGGYCPIGTLCEFEAFSGKAEHCPTGQYPARSFCLG
jgi:hypothetical protein